MKAAAIAGMCCVLSAAGCSSRADERPQWKVVVSSDADVPLWGDRLLVEVLTPSGELACEGCRRVFGLAKADALPLSFGITDTAAAGPLRLQGRLFRSSLGQGAGPGASSAAIDVVGVLGQASDVSLRLPMQCFGVAPALATAESCNPETGSFGAEVSLPHTDGAPPLETGSWEPLVERPCGGSPPDEMVCIAGGAFLLGPKGDPERIDASAPWSLR